jgi:hypothetical protein
MIDEMIDNSHFKTIEYLYEKNIFKYDCDVILYYARGKKIKYESIKNE